MPRATRASAWTPAEQRSQATRQRARPRHSLCSDNQWIPHHAALHPQGGGQLSDASNKWRGRSCLVLRGNEPVLRSMVLDGGSHRPNWTHGLTSGRSTTSTLPNTPERGEFVARGATFTFASRATRRSHLVEIGRLVAESACGSTHSGARSVIVTGDGRLERTGITAAACASAYRRVRLVVVLRGS